MKPGFVYFIQRGENGPIKIGYTRRIVDRRMLQIQPTTPEPLHVLFIVAATPTDERFYHSLFSPARIRGEWFEPSPAIDLFIKALSNDSRLAEETRELQRHLEAIEDNESMWGPGGLVERMFDTAPTVRRRSGVDSE